MIDADKRLIRKAKNGNKRAFGKLVDKYQDKVLYLAYDLLGNYEDAKDLAQEIFMRIFDRLHTFQERSRFSTWLYRVAVNLALDFRRRHHKNMLESLDESLKEIDDRNGGIHSLPQIKIETDELREQIERALGRVSINQRTAVVLRYFHDKSTKEIAEIMNCHENTVRVHNLRAMAKLKKYLRAYKTEI